MGSALASAEETRDAIRALGGTRCDTVGCRSEASAVIDLEGLLEAVCGPCLLVLLPSPALRVRLALVL